MSEKESFDSYNIFQSMTIDKIEDYGEYIQLTLADKADKILKLDVSVEVAQALKIKQEIVLKIEPAKEKRDEVSW